MQGTGAIWTIAREGHIIKIIPAKFGNKRIAHLSPGTSDGVLAYG